MNKTSIEWVKNPDGTQGYTWNPITGCLNGCDYCYARKLANGRLSSVYLKNSNWEEHYREQLNDPFYPRFWEDRLDELNPVYGQDTRALHRGIFVCDMSDLFGIGVPEEWTKRILDRIKEFPLHRFYLLTKQPQNLIKFSPFPDNCYVGVTCTDYTMFHNAIPHLNKIQAKVKFTSLEPLLAPIHLQNHILDGWLDWVIIGAQTKPYKPPKIEWVQEIVQACDKAGIPVFLKDNLEPILASSFNGGDVIESHNLWAFKQFKLRQELPK